MPHAEPQPTPETQLLSGSALRAEAAGGNSWAFHPLPPTISTVSAWVVLDTATGRAKRAAAAATTLNWNATVAIATVARPPNTWIERPYRPRTRPSYRRLQFTSPGRHDDAPPARCPELTPRCPSAPCTGPLLTYPGCGSPGRRREAPPACCPELKPRCPSTAEAEATPLIVKRMAVIKVSLFITIDPLVPDH